MKSKYIVLTLKTKQNNAIAHAITFSSNLASFLKILSRNMLTHSSIYTGSSETYLEFRRISTIEHFCENN